MSCHGSTPSITPPCRSLVYLWPRSKDTLCTPLHYPVGSAGSLPADGNGACNHMPWMMQVPWIQPEGRDGPVRWSWCLGEGMVWQNKGAAEYMTPLPGRFPPDPGFTPGKSLRSQGLIVSSVSPDTDQLSNLRSSFSTSAGFSTLPMDTTCSLTVLAGMLITP